VALRRILNLEHVEVLKPTANECGGVDMPQIWWEIISLCLSYKVEARPPIQDVERLLLNDRGHKSEESIPDNTSCRQFLFQAVIQESLRTYLSSQTE
jgi:hypothetical protein